MISEATILIVEDDEQLAYLLREQLQEEGYAVVWAHDGVEGLRMLHSHLPDLVLLDVLMPRMDGWETCHCIRALSDVPIIMLSCLAGEMDKVRGLDIGADDYVIKPFSPLELASRIRAVLRRSRHPVVSKQLVEVDDRLAIDRTRREVLVDGQVVDLSPTEYKLLACLLDHAGRVLTHRSLLTQVWGWEHSVETGYLKVYIHQLRKKIEKDPKQPSYVLTERGLGYRFQISGLS